MGRKKRQKFLMYTDLERVICGLNDEDAGLFFKAILAKVNGDNSEVPYPNLFASVWANVEMENYEQSIKLVKKRKAAAPAEQWHTEIKEIFMSYFLFHKKFDYAWAAKDAKSLNTFITKCRNISDTEIQVRNLAAILIKTTKENSPWVFDRLSVSLLNSMFNDIVDAYKNGRKKKVDTSFQAAIDVKNEDYDEEM